MKDTVPTINGYEITRLKDKKELNIALGIISKMYHRRALTEKTTEAVELMAIDALLNTDKQQHPADFYSPVPPESPDYPVSMISCLPPKIHPREAPINTDRHGDHQHPAHSYPPMSPDYPVSMLRFPNT